MPHKQSSKQPQLTPAFVIADSETKRRPTTRPPLPESHADVALADIADLIALTRMGRSWLHAAVRRGDFPAPAIREPRCTRWRLADVRAWLIERVSTGSDPQIAKTLTGRAKKAGDAAQSKRIAAMGADMNDTLRSKVTAVVEAIDTLADGGEAQ